MGREVTRYSAADLALGAPTLLLAREVRSKTLAMHNVPKYICSQSTDGLLVGNQMEPRPACLLFGNNKEADGPATKGNVNVYMLDANKAIIKLRTSI